MTSFGHETLRDLHCLLHTSWVKTSLEVKYLLAERGKNGLVRPSRIEMALYNYTEAN